MGTGSKSSHESYAVSPTALAELPSSPADLTGLEAEGHGGGEGAAEPIAADEAGAGQPVLKEDPAPETIAQTEIDDPDDEFTEDLTADLFLDEESGSGTDDAEIVDGAAEPWWDAAQGVDESSTETSSLAAEADDLAAQEDEEEETDPPLTPVPAAPPVGEPTGASVLVGGEDFIHSEATLVAYNSADGPREVLLAHVSEEAEEKLLDALSIPGTHMEDVEVEEEVKDRLQLDKDKKLDELTKTAIKSVQHKLKHDLPMSDASIAKHQTAVDAVSSVLTDPGASDEEWAMAQHYLDQLNLAKDKIENGGGPLPWMDSYEVTTTQTVTKQVAVPNGEPEPGSLEATVRKASRIEAKLDPETGQTSWDGVSRSYANGTEYEIDMGDGWKAVYRPYKENDPSTTEYSLRGQLEVHAPAGEGHGQDLVERLEQLHLVNKPMSSAEGEWTYLSNNIQAQGMGNAAGMAAAMATAQGLEDLKVQEIVHQRMDSLMGLDSDALQTQMKRIHLEAAQKVLPMKVDVVRDAVAKAAGFGSGAELAASPGYEPAPSTSGGWLTWSRFDVTGKQEEVQNAFAGKALTHKIGSGDLASLLGTGVLASTEKRAVMGIGSGVGMSEEDDKMTGGANSVFLRVQSSPDTIEGGVLIWDDPTVLMRRSDYYAYSGDHYGAINPNHYKYSKNAMTRDPMKIANYQGDGNEVMFRNGIDLIGAEAPSRIVCWSAGERQKILASFAARGITELGGKPVEDVLCVS
ncbi:hypothetical protein OG800_49410 (plasmid) [Streptomyces sp. NBC_00445]|uniref:hypothetical protein n=1 Tax=Streptomyces sp. NBC_00445 TaxID=2975745 RepID=UPI002E217D8D